MGDPAREVDMGGDTPLLQGSFDFLFQLTISTDKHMEILVVAENSGECLGEMLDAFLCAQAADVADEVGAVVIGGGDSEGGEVEEVTMGNEDFVAVGGEVPFGDEGGRVYNNVVAQTYVYFCECICYSTYSTSL